MAYTYTPSQQIDIAKRRITSESAVAETALSSMLAMAENEPALDETQTTATTSKQSSDAGFFRRALETSLDWFKSVTMGLGKAVEGFIDFGASTVGTFAGWFGNDTLKQDASDYVAVNQVGNLVQELEESNEFFKFSNSFINDMSETGQRIVRGVGEGVGQMIPNVLLAAATGGISSAASGSIAASKGLVAATKAANTINNIGKVANLTLLGMSAAGTGTEEALNYEIEDEDGNITHPSLDRAYLYGLASGAVEVATETLVGGPYEKVFGSGVADKLINKLAKSSGFNKAVRFAIGAMGEGVEEVVSEALSNTLQTIYNSSDGKVHWESPDVQAMIEAGVIGTLTSAVMAGGESAVRKISTKASVQDSMLEYDNIQKKADNLSRDGGLSAEEISNLDAESTKALNNISKRYQKASEKGRERMLKSMPSLADFINTEDGSIKQTTLEEGAVEITPEQASVAMSGSLAVSRRNEVANTLKRQNLTLASDIDTTQQENMHKLRNALKLTGKVLGRDVKVVVCDNIETANSFLDGDIMYISKERLSSAQSTAQDFAHEVFHYSEGSTEYKKLVSFMDSVEVNGESLLKVALDKVMELGYNIDESIYEKIIRGESLDGENDAEVYTAVSEMDAKAAEYLFGNEEIVNKLIERDSGFARKLLSRMKDFAKVMKSVFKGEKGSVASLRQMNKGIRLFEKALATGGETYALEKAYERAVEQESKKGFAQRDPSTVSRKEYEHHYWATANNVLERNELGQLNKVIGDIKNGDYYPQTTDGEYMIAVGNSGNKIVFTDGKYNYYSISKVIEIITSDEYRLDDIRRTIYEREGNGILTENTHLLKIYAGIDYAFSDFRKKIRHISGDSSVQQDGRGSSGENESGDTPNKKGVKYSLKLSEYQRVIENLDLFESVDDIKNYFGEVMIEINGEPFYPKTMEDVSKHERERIQKLIESAQIEKEAIKEWRKRHSQRKGISLETKAQIEEVDRRYQQAIQNNELETAKYLVEQMAILKGYSVTDYRIDHTAPYKDGYSASLDDVSSVYGDDIYSDKAARYFGTFEGFDNESIGYIQHSKGNPNGTIIAYRAVPTSVKSNQIRNGDWITLTYQYAKNHGEGNIIGNYRIIKKRVRIGDVYTNGDSIHEFGYDDGNQYYYRDTENYRKLADVITFDDEGNPIHLRDRFDYRNSDIRYSLRDNADIKASRKPIQYLSYDSVGQEVVRNIRGQLSKIYDGTSDGVADGIAIESGDDIYIVDSGMDNGDIRFGIRNIVKILDKTLRKERMVKINDRAIQNGFISEHLLGEIGSSSDKHSTSSVGRQLQKELSVDTEQSQDNERGISDGDGNRGRRLKYSLKENAEQEILDYYGKTYKWSEAVYLFKDGTRLDGSGRVEGASGGYRTVDHRDVFDILTANETQGNEAMIEFMSRGNIRVTPETPGINLQVEPTEEQYRRIQEFVETVGFREQSFLVDFDDANGNVVDTLEYNGRVSGRKVVDDIKHYFKEGTLPYKSELSRFRYSKKEDGQIYRISEGQIKKIIANNTRKKVYTRAETEGVVNTILRDYLKVDYHYGELSKKSEAAVVDMLWKSLNSADPDRRGAVALRIADYIIKSASLRTFMDDIEMEQHVALVNELRPYLHSIDLSSIKGEIRSMYGKDKGPFLLWGKRKTSTKVIGIDELRMHLEDAGIHIEATTQAELFYQIDKAYRNAEDLLKSESKQMLSSSLSTEELKTLKNSLALEILKTFDTTGAPSKLAKIIEKYENQALDWKQKYYEEKERNLAVNTVLDVAKKLKEVKLGTFLNASVYKTDIFKKSIEKLSNIQYRGNLNESGTRRIVSGLKEWYDPANPILEGEIYDSDIAQMLDFIDSGEGKLNAKELKALSNVIRYFTHFVENYNKIWKEGKYIDAQPLATQYVSALKVRQQQKISIVRNLIGKYLESFGDPISVMRLKDGYLDGFCTDMFQQIRTGEQNAAIDEMQIKEPLQEFNLAHKKYWQYAEKRTVSYTENELPLFVGMSLYMTLNDSHSMATLAENGFTYYDHEKQIRIDGFAKGENLEGLELQDRVNLIQIDLKKQFSDLDLELIGIYETILNEECKKRYRETSIILKGYSNEREGIYFPIKRVNIAKTIDTTSLSYELSSITDPSFSKERITGAKGELLIENVDVVVNRHIRGMALYSNLAPTLDAYNKIYNLNTADNNNKPISVSTELKNVWAKGESYFQKLISDIKGIKVDQGVGMRTIATIRKGYVKFQLGANLKVLMTQLSSLFAATSILDTSSVIRGFGVSAKDVDEYCLLAKHRNLDGTAAKAAGVLDYVDNVGDLLMKNIGRVDRFVIKRLFGACQVQVQKDSGLKIGTIENKTKAGELLKRVILETQQNAFSTDRSAAMRSPNEIAKSLTMFRADSMKVFGRVVDSIGEYLSLKDAQKAITDASELNAINSKLKLASKKIVKSTSALVSSAIFMALVAQLFKTLYARDDEDDNILKNMLVDFGGNLLGGLPIIVDVYNRFLEGYDFESFTYSSINDLFDTTEETFTSIEKLIAGEATSQEVAKAIKDITYSAGQLLGIPTRNIYNLVTGLTKRFSSSAGYKIESVFYNKSYSSDLSKAIEKDDEQLMGTIIGLMLEEDGMTSTSKKVNKKLRELAANGYSVLPRTVTNTITYEGETIKLSNGNQKAFKTIYGQANDEVESLVSSKAFNELDNAIQAKSIKWIYNYYYNKAITNTLGVESNSKASLFGETMEPSKFAMAFAACSTVEGKVDRNGNTITGGKRIAVVKMLNQLSLTRAEKAILLAYLGYSVKDYESLIVNYIKKIGLTKTQQTAFMSYVNI